MTAWLVAFFGLAGAAIGSFLNVCVYRWPAGLSVSEPKRSFCPSCRNPIRWYDNVPVLGWLILRGRCRDCRSWISPQYPLVELVVAIIWATAALRHGYSIEALRGAIYLTALLGIALTDVRHMVIPDQLSLGGAAVVLALAAVPGGFPFATAVLGAAVWGLAMWAVMVVAEKAFGRPALGLGDVFLMILIGAQVGAFLGYVTLIGGAVLGVLIAVPIKLAQGRLRWLSTEIPFGVFLALAGAAAWVFGDPIVFAYCDLQPEACDLFGLP